MASRHGGHRQSAGNYAHSRRRARRQDPRADGSGPHLSRWLGRGGRLHPAALRLGTTSGLLTARAAPGLGSCSVRRATGRTGTSSAMATITSRRSADLHQGCGHASRCRRALPSAHGGRATGHTATRSSMELVRASAATMCRSTCWSSTWTGTRPMQSFRWNRRLDQSGHSKGWSGYSWNKLLFPDPDAVLEEHSRRGPQGDPQYASRIRRAAVGRRLSGDGASHGHRSGDRKVRAVRHHRQEVRHQLHQPAASSAGKTGHRFLVARLAAGSEYPDRGRKPHLVAELRAFHRSAARGQAPAALPSLGRTGQPPLPDRLLGRHHLGVGVAGISAMVHGHRGQRWLCILEP